MSSACAQRRIGTAASAKRCPYSGSREAAESTACTSPCCGGRFRIPAVASEDRFEEFSRPGFRSASLLQLAAIVERFRTGRGRKVDTSLLETAKPQTAAPPLVASRPRETPQSAPAPLAAVTSRNSRRRHNFGKTLRLRRFPHRRSHPDLDYLGGDFCH